MAEKVTATIFILPHVWVNSQTSSGKTCYLFISSHIIIFFYSLSFLHSIIFAFSILIEGKPWDLKILKYTILDFIDSFKFMVIIIYYQLVLCFNIFPVEFIYSIQSAFWLIFNALMLERSRCTTLNWSYLVS